MHRTRATAIVGGDTIFKKTANTKDHARLDVAAKGLWGRGRYERTFVDMRIFNPFTPPPPHIPEPANVHMLQNSREDEKRAYEQRICEVEHATFTPLVLSVTGGMVNEASHFYKRVASQLAAKWGQSYSFTF